MMNDLFQRGEAHAQFTQENAGTAGANRFYPWNRSTVRSSFNNFKKGERGNGSWACYKSIPIENLKFLEIAMLDKFFDHTGKTFELAVLLPFGTSRKVVTFSGTILGIGGERRPYIKEERKHECCREGTGEKTGRGKTKGTIRKPFSDGHPQ